MTNPCETCCEDRPEEVKWYENNEMVKNYWEDDDGKIVVLMNGWCKDCSSHIQYIFGKEEVCGDCESQYKEPCKNCKLVLSEDVAIMCCENKDGREMVVCSECWFDLEDEWRAEGWTCDEDDCCPYCESKEYSDAYECCKHCDFCKTYVRYDNGDKAEGWTYPLNEQGDQKCPTCSSK